MSESLSVFISFSQRDQHEVRELFAGLKVQRVDVWDYSDAGQELPAGASLNNALRNKIDSCDYFVPVISANSIAFPTPVFEVRYAIESGKAKDKVVPILLNDPPAEWATLYSELADLAWIPITTNNDTELENAVRRICERLSIPYIPLNLLDPDVFFSGPFLREIRSKRLQNAIFVQLTRAMDTAGRELLNTQETYHDKWKLIKNKMIAFIEQIDQEGVSETFFYPEIIRGVAELQLSEIEPAEKTFLHVTRGQNIDNEWLGLAFAGLGHTYFSMERFEDSVNAFQHALDLLPGDKKVRVNYLTALTFANVLVLDDEVGDLLEDKTLPADDRIKLLVLRGIIEFKQQRYGSSIASFAQLDADDLSETAAVYYVFALREYGEEYLALEVLENAAHRIKSGNLYQHLAHAYLRIGDSARAAKIYESTLLPIVKPPEFARQNLVEYAQVIRLAEGPTSVKAKQACERAIDFSLFPQPQSKSDYYFTGFAFYLLGNDQLARFFFQYSSAYSTEYYDKAELKASD
jgi:tetratricopeptide (TPR) repeat protein